MNLENPLENQKDEYLILKENFLSGKKSLKEVRDFLLQKDQETADRKGSIKNLEFLKDRDIVNYFLEKAEHQEKDAYYRFLSFTEFHVAQIELLNGNVDTGKEHVLQAISCYDNVSEVIDEQWVPYMQATLSYLNGELIEDDIIESVRGNNIQILKKLNQALKERGFPDYKEDYGK